jgi:hypothetical protein
MDDSPFGHKDRELANVRASRSFDPEEGVLVTMTLPSERRATYRMIYVTIALFSGFLFVSPALLMYKFWDDPETPRGLLLVYVLPFLGLGVFVTVLFIGVYLGMAELAIHSEGVAIKAPLRGRRFVHWREFQGYRTTEWGLGRDKISLQFEDGKEMTINPTMHEFERVVELVRARLQELPEAPEDRTT